MNQQDKDQATRLREQISSLVVELEKIEERDQVAERMPFVGRCFKYLNSYGHGDDNSWWKYFFVFKIEETCLIAFSFQIDYMNKISVDLCDRFLVSKRHEEISREEFAEAWRALREKLAVDPFMLVSK